MKRKDGRGRASLKGEMRAPGTAQVTRSHHHLDGRVHVHRSCASTENGLTWAFGGRCKELQRARQRKKGRKRKRRRRLARTSVGERAENETNAQSKRGRRTLLASLRSASLRTIVAADEAVAIRIFARAADILLRLLQGNVHEAIQTRERACAQNEGQDGARWAASRATRARSAPRRHAQAPSPAAYRRPPPPLPPRRTAVVDAIVQLDDHRLPLGVLEKVRGRLRCPTRGRHLGFLHRGTRSSRFRAIWPNATETNLDLAPIARTRQKETSSAGRSARPPACAGRARRTKRGGEGSGAGVGPFVRPKGSTSSLSPRPGRRRPGALMRCPDASPRLPCKVHADVLRALRVLRVRHFGGTRPRCPAVTFFGCRSTTWCALPLAGVLAPAASSSHCDSGEPIIVRRTASVVSSPPSASAAADETT